MQNENFITHGDIIVYILSYLSERTDIEYASLVCKGWNKAAHHSSLLHIWNRVKNWQRFSLLSHLTEDERLSFQKLEQKNLMKWKEILNDWSVNLCKNPKKVCQLILLKNLLYRLANSSTKEFPKG